MVNAAVTRRYLQKIFSKADQVRGNCSCFRYFFLNKLIKIGKLISMVNLEELLPALRVGAQGE